MKEEVILTILPHQLREVLKRENIDFQSIQEIRLRVGKPLILLYRGNEVIPEAEITSVDIHCTLMNVR